MDRDRLIKMYAANMSNIPINERGGFAICAVLTLEAMINDEDTNIFTVTLPIEKWPGLTDIVTRMGKKEKIVELYGIYAKHCYSSSDIEPISPVEFVKEIQSRFPDVEIANGYFVNIEYVEF